MLAVEWFEVNPFFRWLGSKDGGTWRNFCVPEVTVNTGGGCGHNRTLYMPPLKSSIYRGYRYIIGSEN